LLYRAGTVTDAPLIAALHADSWRRTYAFALPQEFIDSSLDANRAELWAERMSERAPNQHVILAEERGVLAGFACLFGDHEPEWGTLLDNLHVGIGLRRTGVGRGLVARCAQWCIDAGNGSGLYLWVLEENANARGFYAHLGASDVGPGMSDLPAGEPVPSRRYAWSAAELPALAASAR
jgi:GNAT superfamily N-acetyltransferase